MTNFPSEDLTQAGVNLTLPYLNAAGAVVKQPNFQCYMSTWTLPNIAPDGLPYSSNEWIALMTMYVLQSWLQMYAPQGMPSGPQSRVGTGGSGSLFVNPLESSSFTL